MKMNLEKWVVVVATIIIFIIPLIIGMLNSGEKEVTNNPNKSTIAIDKFESTVYTKHTDKLSLADSSRSLKSNKKATDQLDLIVAQKAEEKIKLRQEEMEAKAKKVAEAKRIKEEKRIAAEKAKKVELARIAEEKKKAAQVEATRIAEAKKKQEAKKVAQSTPKKKEEAKVASVSRGSNYQSNYSVTFYTADCTGCSGISASGVDVRGSIYHQGLRVVAAPPQIALGTKLRITFANGSTMDAIALDRGGAIKGKILDILVSTQSEAIANGRQQVKVEILN